MKSIFTDTMALDPQLEELIVNPSIYNRYLTLSAYFKEIKLKYSQAEYQKLQTIIREKIVSQFRYVAFCSYQKMKVTNIWGNAGESQAKATFARVLLNLPVTTEVKSSHMAQFEKEVETEIAALNIAQLSLEALNMQIDQFKLVFFSKDFKPSEWNNLEKILEFLEVPLYLIMTRMGEEKVFLLGEGLIKNIFGYDVLVLEKELIRSPNTIVAMAALIYGRRIVIRKVAFETIFSQKWHSFAKEKNPIGFDLATGVSNAIKAHVLSLYGVKNEDDLLAKKAQFMEEMIETIIYHEIGHGGVEHDIIDAKFNAIGEATALYGQSIYHDLLEFLADFVPTTGKIKGPIQNMIDISKTDKAKATRMYYMYLSDTWFFDTPDVYMYTYSSAMALALSKYIKKDKQVDFKKLERDIQNKDGSDGDSLFARIVSLFEKGIKGVEEIVLKAKYGMKGDYSFTYLDIKNMNLRSFKNKNVVVDWSDSRYLGYYWACILNNVKNLSDSKEKMQKFLVDRHEKVLKRLFILYAGREKAEKYDLNYTKYIQDKYKKLFIPKNKSSDAKKGR